MVYFQSFQMYPGIYFNLKVYNCNNIMLQYLFAAGLKYGSQVRSLTLL